MFCTASPIAHAWNVGLCPPGTGGHFPAARNLSRNCQGRVGRHLPGSALSPQLTWLAGGPGAVSGVWTRPLHSFGGPGSPCCSLGLWPSGVSAWWGADSPLGHLPVLLACLGQAPKWMDTGVRKDHRPVRTETMCPQTQCGARCWPAPGPLGSQALDLRTQACQPSTAWFSPGGGHLVSAGGSPAMSEPCPPPARAWPCLWGSGGRVGCLPGLDPAFPAFAWGAWLWGVAISCTCGPCSLSLPCPGSPATRRAVSSAFWGMPPWDVLGLPVPCAQGLQVGRGLGGAPFPSSIL